MIKLTKFLKPGTLKTVGRVGAEGAGAAAVGVGVERSLKKRSEKKSARRRVPGRRRLNRSQQGCIYGKT